MMHFLCIDIGTSYLKTAIVSGNGSIIEKQRHPLHLSYSNGYLTMYPEEWHPALSKMLASFRYCNKIDAVSITGNGPSLIALSHKQTILQPALSWMDRSCTEEAQIIAHLSGSSYDASFYLAKALRLIAIHGMDTIWKFFSGPEYLAYCIGSEPVSYLPSSGYEPYIWNNTIHEQLGLRANLFPPYAEPGTIIGYTKPNGLKLPENIPIIAAYPDFLAAIAGTGCIEPGYICDRTGSSETLNACSECYDDALPLLRLPHLIPNLWNLSGGVSTSGKALEWFCKLHGPDYLFESCIEDAHSAPFDPSLMFLPFLNGERAPIWNNTIRGQFLNIGLNHTRQDLARAVIEGIVFGLRFTYDKLVQLIKKTCIIRPSGFLADFPFINQLKADIFATTIETGLHPEGELLGCAAIALKGITKNLSISEACKNIFTLYSSYTPSQDYINYEEKYHKFINALTNTLNTFEDKL